jgi:two-component system, cell cycle response regulator
MTEQAGDARPAFAAGQRPRVLVVDDARSARSFISELLADRGFEPTATASAEEALAEFHLRWPDAVVLDLWLPGVSGLQLCRLVRREAQSQSLPIVVLSGTGSRRSRFWARCAGASAYLTKPEAQRLPDLLVELLADVAPNTRPPSRHGAHQPIQEALSALLDRQLFEATLRGELRALADGDGDGPRLFAGLVDVLASVCEYRWLALRDHRADTVYLHAGVADQGQAVEEASRALDAAAHTVRVAIVDERALPGMGKVVTREIAIGPRVLGVLALGLPGPRARAEEEQVVDLAAGELGVLLRLHGLIADAKRLAMTDPLTGLMNRRAFLEAVERERVRVIRYKLPFSLVMIDIDHFKLVNDNHGHHAGDAVLRGVARLLHQLGRKSDIIGRWGGEELAIALPHTNEAGALVVAERVRAAIASTPQQVEPGHHITVTASIGVASTDGEIDVDGLLMRADTALYRAKGAGRNQVIAEGKPNENAAAPGDGRRGSD